jgi:hypothetical protein
VATRKQRARRAKSKRHEYEVVYLDSEGNEVEPDEVEPSKTAKDTARSTTSTSKRSSTSSSKSRVVREPKPPSWPRAIRRGAIFMPILIAVVVFTNRKQTTPVGLVLVVIVFTGLVIPFGYFTDHLAWRAYQKRVDRKSPGKSAKR